MIISASRRTDIPAFYAEWFMNRIRAGYCAVPNPFNRRQVSYVSLKPEDVDVIVFWTRNARPLFRYLSELDERGYLYYFQYTAMNNPKPIDKKSPSLRYSIRTFTELSDLVGPDRVIWRYDPIVFSNVTDVSFHVLTYSEIARALRGHTRRCVISVMDVYKKATKRLKDLEAEVKLKTDVLPYVRELIPELVRIARTNDMEVVSCAEDLDLSCHGVRPGKCIDDEYIAEVFGIKVTGKKDPYQRAVCGCVVSKDIGMYDSCLYGCQYCYATASFDRAKRNFARHDPHSPSLIGWYDASPPSEPAKQPGLWEDL